LPLRHASTTSGVIRCETPLRAMRRRVVGITQTSL
jgi:hypothetical protein